VAPVTISATEIGHLHELRNHGHQLAAAIAPEHAHDVATPIGRKGRAAAADAAAAEHAAKATAAIHHPAHHRSHGLHQHAEPALAHLRFHHLEHRRHLGHHVAASAANATTEARDLGPGRDRRQRQQQQQQCRRLANHLVSSSHGSAPFACARTRGRRGQPDARHDARECQIGHL